MSAKPQQNTPRLFSASPYLQGPASSASAVHPLDRRRGSKSVSSLDPTETNRQSAWEYDIAQEVRGNPPSEVAFRHSGTLHYRQRTVQAFGRLGLAQARADRYAACGTNAWVVRTDEPTPRYAVHCDRCHDRFCPACARERGLRYAQRIADKATGQRTRFVTLTLRHTNNPLSQQLARLTKCFAQLRRTILWSKCIKGGVAIIEIKLSSRNAQWHPHLHAITVGGYLPQKLLSQAWYAITGDSFIVDVRACRDSRELANYVTKYVTKPIHGDVYRSPAALDEAIDSFRGRRLATTFGSWRGFALNQAPETDVAFVQIGRLRDFLHRARSGDRDAESVLRSITNAKHYLLEIKQEDLHFG